MRLDRLSIASAAAIAVLALTAACSGGESQSETAKDVASARQDAAQDVTQARTEAAEDVKGAAKDVRDEQKDVREEKQDLSNVGAQGAYDVEIAKVEGDHKVAVEKCGMLTGDSLKACTNQADADYDAAKARAKATLEATHQ
jgi:hypothetical protein